MKHRVIAAWVLVAVVTVFVPLKIVTQESLAHSGSGSCGKFAEGDAFSAAAWNSCVYSHLHGTFTAGITDSNIATGAGISDNKMAFNLRLPKAVADMGATVCTVGTCTLAGSVRVTSIVFSATGVYNVTLGYTPVSTGFFAIPVSHTASVFCIADTPAVSTPHFKIKCYSDAGVATNAAVGFTVFDFAG